MNSPDFSGPCPPPGPLSTDRQYLRWVVTEGGHVRIPPKGSISLCTTQRRVAHRPGKSVFAHPGQSAEHIQEQAKTRTCPRQEAFLPCPRRGKHTHPRPAPVTRVDVSSDTYRYHEAWSNAAWPREAGDHPRGTGRQTVTTSPPAARGQAVTIPSWARTTERTMDSPNPALRPEPTRSPEPRRKGSKRPSIS